MIKNPKRIVAQWIVSQLKNPEKQIQQNWIDLTVKSVKHLLSRWHMSEERRWTPDLWYDNLVWKKLAPGVYSVEFNEYVKIPNGLCAQIHQRSSINRCWVLIQAGLYDAWFENTIWAVMYVINEYWFEVEKDTRLAQIVFNEAEEGDLYDWVYHVKNQNEWSSTTEGSVW